MVDLPTADPSPWGEIIVDTIVGILSTGTAVLAIWQGYKHRDFLKHLVWHENGPASAYLLLLL